MAEEHRSFCRICSAACGIVVTTEGQQVVKVRGDAELALLAGHGVFVLGGTVRAVHQRAVALEQRCKHAWHVRAAGGSEQSPLPSWYVERSRLSDGNRFLGFWEAMARAELRADPTLLEERG